MSHQVCLNEEFDEIILFDWIDPNGDYYRLLPDGSYAIEVKKSGYGSEVQFIDVHNKDQQKSAERVDFTLRTVSSDRANLKQMLRQFMEKVSWIIDHSFHFFIV